MGCLFSRFFGSRQPLEEVEDEKPVYSWDHREKKNIKDYTIENLDNETAGRLPGSVGGEQFIIKNCKDSSIYVFDHSATISIDDCVNCNIFLGPVKTSVFIRDCKQCRLIVACQQFRTRDCSKLDVFLCCDTQPIIEATHGLRVACFQYFYPELEAQFRASGRSVFSNNWYNIHDFTPVPDETNFSFLPEDAKVEDYIPLPAADQFASMGISIEPNKSVVPMTTGTRRKKSDESCLVIFFDDGSASHRALTVIRELKSNKTDCVLVQSKEVTLQPFEAQRVFGTDSYALAVQQGPVIGLEFNGEGVIAYCQKVVVDLTKGTTGLVFVSQNLSSANQQIENFFSFAEMQMSM
ncbi:protein XRP2-like [Gigantopelta aegis]|uniref:protein XRP2-like n=1 Tax=Gigantopelta aegis TaxID=1735272 RepID=UPI001B88A41F|nr:protein XRP2-like [Gigantopelta aegis]